ncbi:TlpA disulfide reductase family protein [Cytophagales bacterium LB-30]|uniref:TlpA disulfide reductase family protein n=1 Tax=Shiella aurantiaca TaxID=3058365 RepID=A0ABT8F112_9BACT|nr:TlpA disulfide reductase family protein [Shiella aurantiaca]MDN4164090.1 TlpA disulfide reductase family protein [Shiella aurantiaca]
MAKYLLILSSLSCLLLVIHQPAFSQEEKKIGFVTGGEVMIIEEGKQVSKIFPDDFRDTRWAIGDSLPYFELTDINGQPVSSENIKDKIAILNFTFVGCSGCRVEHESLKKASDLYKNDDRIIFINFISSEPWRIKRYLDKYGSKGYLSVPVSQKMYKDYFRIVTAPTHIFVVNGQIKEAVSAPLWNEESYLFITDFIGSQLF